MATVSSNLLDDLNDLHSDVEDDDDEYHHQAPKSVSGQKRSRGEISNTPGVSAEDLDALSDDEDSDDEEDADGEVPELGRDMELDAQLAGLNDRVGLKAVAKIREADAA